ncbi:MAG TPA: hypothetical protein VN958_03415, partial [Chitinophagaceae bacterium]|nr:hypothetical protein [Chitinophagaceae bacterium]
MENFSVTGFCILWHLVAEPVPMHIGISHLYVLFFNHMAQEPLHISNASFLRQRGNGFQAALRNNYADSAGRFLTDDYRFVGPGAMMNKEQRLASM